jgi:hypothetical protein
LYAFQFNLCFILVLGYFCTNIFKVFLEYFLNIFRIILEYVLKYVLKVLEYFICVLS